MLHSDLSNVTKANSEAHYQALYAACASGSLDAEAALKQISDLHQRTRSPVIKSYCLLFYGAAVDTNMLSANSLTHLSQHLTTLLEGLTDFRVKDPKGHYIHFLSHATYLAQSIHDAGGKVSWKPLLFANLRTEEPFGWNEDIVLAECLLDITPKASFPALLSQRTQRVDGTIFNELVEVLAVILE